MKDVKYCLNCEIGSRKTEVKKNAWNLKNNVCLPKETRMNETTNDEEEDNDENNEDSYDDQSNELNEIERNIYRNINEDEDKRRKFKKNNK